MKNLFYSIEQFMYRRPISSVEGISFSEEEIKEACKDPAFREKVSIASPSLLEMMDSYINDPTQLSEKKKNNLQISIMKYLVRSKTRTTPFGLFSAVGKGVFGKENNFPNSMTEYQKKVNVDSEWLFGYITYLENKYFQRLKFKINDACCVKGDRVALVYSTEKETEEISIRFTEVFDLINNFARDYKEYELIVKRLQDRYGEEFDDKIRCFLKELISKGFLISSLRPSFNNEDPLAYFIHECDAADLVNISKELLEIRELCNNYMNTNIGEGLCIYNQITEKMKTLYCAPSYLQVDTVIGNSEIELDKGLLKEINELASFLVFISKNPKNKQGYLNRYKTKFLEKYGMDREVPLLELFDTSVGIGAPATYLKPQNDFYEDSVVTHENYNIGFRDYFTNEYENAILNGSDISINLEEVMRLTNSTVEPEEIPISLELYFILKQQDGKIMLNLSSNSGSFAAGKTIGRFSVLSDKFGEMLKSISAEERKIRSEAVEMCEISFLPSPIRNGNVVRTLSYKEKETAIFTSGNKEPDQRISLQDISIGIFNDKFYARNKKSGKIVSFGTNNMYNPMLNPNVLRFLQEISQDGIRNWSDFPWNHFYSSFRHVPTIKYKNIVLENEKWRLNINELNLKKMFFEEFEEKFLTIVEMRKMPRYLYIVDADNRISLDLTKKVSLLIIFDELKKHKEGDLVFEKMEEGENIVYEDGKEYTTEVVIPLFRKNKEDIFFMPPERIVVSRQDHLILPFNDWLYLKLYCNKSRENELIAFHILDFCGKLREKNGVDYFYMRYMDPKPHIRLRIHASQQQLLEIYPQIMEWCSNLSEKGVIGDVVLAVYDREVERYGGLELMKQAEQLFFADSYIVERILCLKRQRKMTFDIEQIALISVIMYVINFYEEFTDQLNFLTLNYHSSKYMSNFKKEKDKLLYICDFEENWKNLLSSEDGKGLYSLLCKRNLQIIKYREEIQKENTDSMFKNGIVASVIHLHCNRLLGTNRELERRVMAFAESILYSKKYKMLRRTEENE